MNSHPVLTRANWFLAALLGLGVLSASAKNAPAEIRWNELAGLIIGRMVTIPLAGGVVVRGEALSVRDNSLLVDIRKTSDPHRYPAGQTAIVRASVTEVWITGWHGSGGRILGSVVGALLGIVAGAEVAVHGTHSEAAGVPAFSAGAVACTVAGYLVGRAADRRVSRWRIAPEPEGAAHAQTSRL